MLIIAKRLDEPIRIGDAIVKITQNRYTMNKINFVIDAPYEIKVDRLDAAKINNNEASVLAKQILISDVNNLVFKHGDEHSTLVEMLDMLPMDKLHEMKAFYAKT